MIVVGFGSRCVGRVLFLIVIIVLLVLCRCFMCVIFLVGERLRWISLLWVGRVMLCFS